MTEHNQNDLNRAWDALVTGSPPEPDRIDRLTDDAMRRLHSASDVPGADPAFVSTLWENLMQSDTLATHPPLTSPAWITSRSRPARPRPAQPEWVTTLGRGYQPWQLALIAVTLLVVIAGSASLLRLVPWDSVDNSPAGFVSTSTPEADTDLTTEELFAISIPAELLPPGDYISSSLVRFSVPAGTTATWSEPCCAGPLVELVLSGTYTVTVEDDITVFRADGTAEEVTSGSAVTLNSGDALLSRNEIALAASADLSGPVELLSWMLIDNRTPFKERKLEGWTRIGRPSVLRDVTISPNGVEVAISRVTVANGTVLPLPNGSAGFQVAIADDANDGFIATLDSGAVELRSQSGNDATFFVAAVTWPAAPGTPED